MPNERMACNNKSRGLSNQQDLSSLIQAQQPGGKVTHISHTLGVSHMTTVEVGNSHTVCLGTKGNRSVTLLQAFPQKISKYIFYYYFFQSWKYL